MWGDAAAHVFESLFLDDKHERESLPLAARTAVDGPEYLPSAHHDAFTIRLQLRKFG